MLDFGPHFDTLNMTSLNLYLNIDQTDTSSRSRVTECRAIFQLAKTASFNRGKVNQPSLGWVLDRVRDSRCREIASSEIQSTTSRSPTQQEDSFISHQHTHLCLILGFTICELLHWSAPLCFFLQAPFATEQMLP